MSYNDKVTQLHGDADTWATEAPALGIQLPQPPGRHGVALRGGQEGTLTVAVQEQEQKVSGVQGQVPLGCSPVSFPGLHLFGQGLLGLHSHHSDQMGCGS